MAADLNQLFARAKGFFVDATDNAVGQAGGILIIGGHCGNRRGVFGHAHAYSDERRFVDIGYRDGDGLGVAQRAVAGFDDDVIDVVCAAVGRRFEVGCGEESQGPGSRVDTEFGRICATGEV